MMEKESIRKADIFSSAIIVFFGAWVVRQAFKMPMKDSWGGVQNVWFVSPALFPLFVGIVLMILGISLMRTAFTSVGYKQFSETLHYLLSNRVCSQLSQISNIRFYAIAVLFLSFIYLNIPRIDFFLCSVLFLVAFITMFYFEDDDLLKKLFIFYLAGSIVLILFFSLGFTSRLRGIPYIADILAICFIISYSLFAWTLVRKSSILRKKYRTSMIITIAAPFTICPFFKYFLLVPMPYEGLVVAIMDYFWYFE